VGDEQCIVDFVDEGWIRYKAVGRLIYEVLYREFGVPEDGDWHQPAEEDVQVAALCGFALAGSARLVTGPDKKSAQLRQVAVAPEFRGRGVGRALVQELESWARGAGFVEVWLNARDSAFEFYERLGYEYTGELFTSELTGIPHRRMRKLL